MQPTDDSNTKCPKHLFDCQFALSGVVIENITGWHQSDSNNYSSQSELTFTFWWISLISTGHPGNAFIKPQ